MYLVMNIHHYVTRADDIVELVVVGEGEGGIPSTTEVEEEVVVTGEVTGSREVVEDVVAVAEVVAGQRSE